MNKETICYYLVIKLSIVSLSKYHFKEFFSIQICRYFHFNVTGVSSDQLFTFEIWGLHKINPNGIFGDQSDSNMIDIFLTLYFAMFMLMVLAKDVKISSFIFLFYLFTSSKGILWGKFINSWLWYRSKYLALEHKL